MEIGRPSRCSANAYIISDLGDAICVVYKNGRKMESDGWRKKKVVVAIVKVERKKANGIKGKSGLHYYFFPGAQTL